MSCIWEPDPACLEQQWATFDPVTRQRALFLATSSLQMLTHYRVGTCPITIRPCPQPVGCGCGWGSPFTFLADGSVIDPILTDPVSIFPFFQPNIQDGLWYNNCPCGTTCAPLSSVVIPGPVGYIQSLKIDGLPVNLWDGQWRIDNGNILVWQGVGTSPLPSTQNMNLPDTAVGTWSITYSQSHPVGPDARLAVAYLALEFAKACQPRQKCSLPRGVTSVVRNGVSFTVEVGMFPGGVTGIDIVDQFILKWAPAGSPVANAKVFNPRQPGQPRITSAVPMPPIYTGSI